MKAHPLKIFWVGLSYVLLLIPAVAVPALQNGLKNDMGRSTIMYVLVHPFHTVDGVSHEVNSNISLDRSTQGIKSVSVTVPVKSFDSGNKTRDNNMLEVTDAAQYPDVKFQSTSITPANGKLQVEGKLTFDGVTKNVAFTAEQTQQNNDLLVDGHFVISLEDFHVKRPSIFGLKVKDELTIYFHMVYPNARAGT